MKKLDAMSILKIRFVKQCKLKKWIIVKKKHTVVLEKQLQKNRLMILYSQKRVGSEGYQSIRLDFVVHNRRCFLGTLKGLLSYSKFEKSSFYVEYSSKNSQRPSEFLVPHST